MRALWEVWVAPPNDKCRKRKSVESDFKEANEGRETRRGGEDRWAEPVGGAHGSFGGSEEVGFWDEAPSGKNVPDNPPAPPPRRHLPVS